MTTIAPQDPVIKGLLTALATVGFDVGDGRAPANPGTPYSVVYSLDDTNLDGPYNDWMADVTHNVQITTVGATPEQARLLQDKNRPAVMTMTVAGRSVALIRRIDGAGGERDPDLQPPLFYTVDIWEITTTPL